MTESFLHYLWKLKLFNQQEMFSTLGEEIQILNVGEHNTNAGPDFFNAKIKIGNTLWAGNVEVHLKSSDWLKHAHQQDKMYDNIILHVVYEYDKPIFRKDGKVIPVLELKKRIDLQIWNKYEQLQKSVQWIPCANQIKEIASITFNSWLDRLLVERLESKSESILNSLQLNKNNWEETFYHHLARNFGFKVNAVPFELLSKSLPLAYLAKHKNNLSQIEAMLFGQAGMLNKNFSDDYLIELKKEYDYLQKKFKLSPIEEHLWKFLRLRPVNFPTVRIAQFAQLVHQSTHLFSKILACQNTKSIEALFTIATSDYWKTHFVFDKKSPKKSGLAASQEKHFGKDAIHNIIINTVAPFVFVYGMKKEDEQYKEKAISFLENIPAEKNAIIQGWETIGITAKTAYQSQALLQLKNEYCTQKKCLSCSVGNKLLSS